MEAINVQVLDARQLRPRLPFAVIVLRITVVAIGIALGGIYVFWMVTRKMTREA